jgi:hypothetical protein
VKRLVVLIPISGDREPHVIGSYRNRRLEEKDQEIDHPLDHVLHGMKVLAHHP